MNILESVKEEVHSIDPQAEVILFGSRARGDNKPDSDWDFLILLETPGFDKKMKHELWDKLYELELKTDTVISSLIHTKSDWQKRSFTPLYQIIEKEGVAA
jgi:uncharacterized protein